MKRKGTRSSVINKSALGENYNHQVPLKPLKHRSNIVPRAQTRPSLKPLEHNSTVVLNDKNTIFYQTKYYAEGRPSLRECRCQFSQPR